MVSANQIAGFIIQPDLQSIRVNQHHFLDAQIDWRKVKSNVSICSWVVSKILSANQIAEFLRQLHFKKMRLISLVFCMLIEIQKRLIMILTLPVPVPDEEKKISLNFYFHTSLWCLKRFYGGLEDLKTFWGTGKKCENKNLT